MTLRIDDAALATLMPMHARIIRGGRVAEVGPTLRRLGLELPDGPVKFREVFEILRPVRLRDPRCLRELAGHPLRLRLRAVPEAPVLRGLAAALPGGGLILNLSFGIGVVDAVSQFKLTQSEFAATDLAIELLYLHEAKSAVMAESHRLNQQLEDARSIAEEKAFTDALTGLGNRRAMEHAMDLLLDRGETFCVMHLDLDHFKEVNDTYGHAAGDRALVRAAEILSSEMRRQDIATRVGGDEFVVLMHATPTQDALKALGHRIIAELEEPMAFEGAVLNFSGSIGVAMVAPDTAEDPAEIMARADAALYASKTSGRGRVTIAGADQRAAGTDR